MNNNHLERFLRYSKINTRSDINSDAIPSTPSQWEFAEMLVEELTALGFEAVQLDPRDAYVVAKISSNIEGDSQPPAIGWIAHIDTADYPADNINPQVYDNYDGENVLLNQETNHWMTTEEFPNLKNYIGETLITTDGTTLLGADDKAGMVSIIEAGRYLIEHPEIKHGELWFAFGPDEEIGKGAHRFETDKFPAEFAYTADSGVIGKLEYETFNAARLTIEIEGTSVHPGQAYSQMFNALSIAADIHQLFPKDEVPEKTKGYQGFYMLSNISGQLDKAQMTYIIRDHDWDKFQDRKNWIAEQLTQFNQQFDRPRVKYEIQDQYYNMANKISKESLPVQLAIKSYEANGITPDIQPFRGGTDGCIITYKGIPTPNICTGAENLHGCYEFVTVESMEKITDIILTIIELSLEKEA